MSRVGKTLGPALGPRGKMPVPVPPTADISGLIKRYRKMVFVRMRNQPVIRCRVGTESMKEEEIAENVQTVLKAIEQFVKDKKLLVLNKLAILKGASLVK